MIQLIIFTNKIRSGHDCMMFGCDLIEEGIFGFIFTFIESLSLLSFICDFLGLFLFRERGLDISVWFFTVMHGSCRDRLILDFLIFMDDIANVVTLFGIELFEDLLIDITCWISGFFHVFLRNWHFTWYFT